MQTNNGYISLSSDCEELLICTVCKLVSSVHVYTLIFIGVNKLSCINYSLLYRCTSEIGYFGLCTLTMLNVPRQGCFESNQKLVFCTLFLN